MTQRLTAEGLRAINRVHTDDRLRELLSNVATHQPAHEAQVPPVGELHINIFNEEKPELSYRTSYTMAVSPEERAAQANKDFADIAQKLPDHGDSHMHPWSYVQKGLDLKEMVARMDQINCRYSVIMPIPTSIISLMGDRERAEWTLLRATGPLHHCGPSYYVPKEYNRPGLELSPEFAVKVQTLISLNVDTEVDDYTADSFNILAKAEQDKLDPMVTGLHLGSSFSDISLFKKMLRNPGVFTGAGELTLNKELVEVLYADKSGQASLHERAITVGEETMKPDTHIGPAKQLMAALGVAGMPACIHCDIGHYRDDPNDPPKNLEVFSNFLADEKVRHTTIVWAHAGGLGRFVKQSNRHMDELENMLAKHPNLVLDISWNEVAKQLTGDGLDPEAAAQRINGWVAFLNRHSERIMFGSDALAPQSNEAWTSTLRTYSGLLEKLTDEARNNILLKTYQRIYVGARKNVRKFENLVLPNIKDKLTDPTVDAIDMAALRVFRDQLYADSEPLPSTASNRSITSEDVERSEDRLKERALVAKIVRDLDKAQAIIRRREVEIGELKTRLSRYEEMAEAGPSRGLRQEDAEASAPAATVAEPVPLPQQAATLRPLPAQTAQLAQQALQAQQTMGLVRPAAAQPPVGGLSIRDRIRELEARGLNRA